MCQNITISHLETLYLVVLLSSFAILHPDRVNKRNEIQAL